MENEPKIANGICLSASRIKGTKTSLLQGHSAEQRALPTLKALIISQHRAPSPRTDIISGNLSLIDPAQKCLRDHSLGRLEPTASQQGTAAEPAMLLGRQHLQGPSSPQPQCSSKPNLLLAVGHFIMESKLSAGEKE